MTSGDLRTIHRINESIKYRVNRIIKILTSPTKHLVSNLDNQDYGATNDSDISEHLHVLNLLVRMKKPVVLVVEV